MNHLLSIKKYIIALIGISALPMLLWSQAPFCVSHELLEKDPAYKAQFEQINRQIFEFTNAYYQGTDRKVLPSYTLPVVVHLIVPPGTPIGQGNNLTDAQVEAGLALLNESFANKGTFQTNDGVDMGISFCLARRDPNGKPTNGITRNESPLVAETTPCTPFGTNAANDFAIKSLNNWDCKQYINIWLVTDLYNGSFGCGLAGYAYFPGAGCGVDGIVQESRYWITAGGTRVTAHEMGHYFSLNHTFSGGCTNANCLLDGDQVCDTPPDNSSSFAACNTNSCATDSPDLPDDNTNYMDYTSCSPPHFTAGQQVRAIAGLEKGRSSLITSIGCLPVIDWDVALLGLSLNGVECNHNFAPVITFKNNGNQVINNLDITYELNGGAPTTLKWTGTLAPNGTTTYTFAKTVLTVGAYTIKITLNNPNGNPDGYLNNNSITNSFNIYPIPTIGVGKVTGSHCISDATVTVNATGGTPPYLFNSPGNGLTQNDGLFQLLLAGNQRFIVSDNNNCMDTIDVVVPDSCAITTPNQFVVNGNAVYLGGDCYRLTPAVNTAVGSIWYNKKINLKKDFVAEFDMNLGCINANGADGIAFVLQPISTAIGTSGGGLGYEGVKPSLTVEFDTWQNCCNNSTSINSADANDPAQDHVAIMKNGTTNHLSVNNLAGPVDIIPNTNAEDCNFHNVRITWNATQNRLTVFVDCNQRVFYQGDVVASIFNNDPNVFFGFTAATGGAINVHQVCLKYISFLDKIVDPTICSGEKIQVAAPSDFTTYQWSPSTNVSNVNSRNPIFSPTTSTSYIVAMTNKCGNVTRDTVDINVVTLDLDVDTTILNPCSANPTLKLSAKSNETGVSYAINSNVFSTSNGIFVDYDYRFNQNYTLYAKKGNCTISRTIKVAPPKPLTDSLIFQQHVLCNQKGIIYVTGVDGVPPYQYSINNGAFQANGEFKNLDAGIYIVKTKDAAGCEVQRTITINATTKLIDLKIDSSYLKIDCLNDKTFVAVSASGTTPFYYYAIDNKNYTSDYIFKNLTAGKHTIIARDDYGCQSDTLKFDVISNVTKPIVKDTVQICEGQQYTFNNHTYTLQGVYNDTLKTLFGCDSIVITTLLVQKKITNNLNQPLCFGQSITIGSKIYTTTGIYTDTLSTKFGCDSIIVLNLTVSPKITSNISAKLCAPKNYVINNHTYNKTGIYQDTLIAINGCDSIVILDLTINAPIEKIITAQLCESQSITINNNVYNTTGTYRDTMQTNAGCDSIIITKVTISPKKTTNLYQNLCEGQSYTLNGKTYTLAGVYYDTLKTTANCDSLLIITIKQSKSSNYQEKKTLCANETLTINGQQITKAGIYNFTFKNKALCDSFYTLDLTIIDTSVFYQEIILCEGDSLRIGKQIYAQTGVYADILKTITGCDSTLITKIKRGNEAFCEDKYCRMFIPNAFSPNGDLQNDTFEIYTQVVALSQLQIFDRWGDLQYEETSPHPHWDGTSMRGGLMNSGVYVYVLRGICSNGKAFIKKGDVTLLR
jgi:gliding motility-associated-like protein